MSRYVDADALHDALKAKQKWVVRCGDKHNEGYTSDQVHFAIDDAPSIDIVRCKDCIYYDPPHVEDDGERIEYSELPEEAFDKLGTRLVSMDYGVNIGGRCCVDYNCGYAEDKRVYRAEENFCSKGKRQTESKLTTSGNSLEIPTDTEDFTNKSMGKSKLKQTERGYMWTCPNCGLEVHSDFAKCPCCGYERQTDECEGCKHYVYQLGCTYHATCKYEPKEPQTERCYKEADVVRVVEIVKRGYGLTKTAEEIVADMQAETQNSNLTFEKQTDCEITECDYHKYCKERGQTDCGWK